MTTDLCTDDVVVHIATPQVLAADGVGGAGSLGRLASAGGAELGRRLLLAARAGDTQTVLDLMAKGAPFTTDWLGTSPLHLAAANAHVETCSVLLRAGVSRDARTKVERTPLHLAAHAGHARVVRLLLEHGANVDCRDMLRMTPLHWAAAKGHEAAAKELLKRGADPRATCKFKKTPRCLALRAHAPKLAKLLEEALARAEIADSLRQIVPDSAPEETPEQKEFETVRRIQDINPVKVKQQLEKNIKVEAKAEVRGGGGAPGAEALLRRHGITLLPTDDGSTVLSALQSGRTVVLSDAGKLMLKESGSNASAASPRSAATVATQATTGNVTSSTNVTSVGKISSGVTSSGVVLNTKPSKAVKLFTVNNLSGLGGMPATPIRKLINPQDLQQVKIVQLSSDTKILSPSKVVPLKEKKKTTQRPPVKILMNKSNFEKLMASANKKTVVKIGAESVCGDASAASAQGGPEEAPEKECGCACGCGCAAKLSAAQRTLQRLAAELRLAKTRLAKYEPH